MSKRKYEPFVQIKSLADFEKYNCKWYEVNKSGRKMWHRVALESLQVHTLITFINIGVFACREIKKVDKDGKEEN